MPVSRRFEAPFATPLADAAIAERGAASRPAAPSIGFRPRSEVRLRLLGMPPRLVASLPPWITDCSERQSHIPANRDVNSELTPLNSLAASRRAGDR